MCICQLWALFSPLENQYVHPNTSISSPSGAGRGALLSDWAHAVAHQGGVKAARMFHIHTKLEFLISPSGYGVLPAGELYGLPDFVKQLSLFLPREGKTLQIIVSPPLLVWWETSPVLDSNKSEVVGSLVCRTGDPMDEVDVPSAITTDPIQTCTWNGLWGWILLRRGFLSPRYWPAIAAMIKQNKNKNVSWVSEVCGEETVCVCSEHLNLCGILYYKIFWFSQIMLRQCIIIDFIFLNPLTIPKSGLEI